jgi:flagellin-like hook-associated protein FlgL
MTMSANFVSTHYLANSLVQPVMQAQSSLTKAMTELSTGQYADLALQLGDQSGYELSLKEQVQQLQALTTGNSVVATDMSTAQDALTSVATSARTTVQNLAGWIAGSTGAGSQLQLSGQTALQDLISSANASASGGYVFGGINSSQQPLANYFSNPGGQNALSQTFNTSFGYSFPPTSSQAASITAAQMQSFLLGPYAALFTGSNWSNWSSASQNVTTEIAPNKTVTTSASINTISATTTGSLTVNLPANGNAANDPAQSTSLLVHDSQGTAHTISFQFTPQGVDGNGNDTWQVDACEDGSTIDMTGLPQYISFDPTTGSYLGSSSTVGGALASTPLSLTLQGSTNPISLDLSKSTQLPASTSFSVTSATADGSGPTPATIAFQQLSQAYTMLSVFGNIGLNSSAQQTVVNQAESLITPAQSSLTNTQAALGATQSQVTDANNAMSSQLTLLQGQIGNLDNVDATTTAAQITSLTNQIQMAYELTSRLSQLSLAQYLPV